MRRSTPWPRAQAFPQRCRTPCQLRLTRPWAYSTRSSDFRVSAFAQVASTFHISPVFASRIWNSGRPMAFMACTASWWLVNFTNPKQREPPSLWRITVAHSTSKPEPTRKAFRILESADSGRRLTNRVVFRALPASDCAASGKKRTGCMQTVAPAIGDPPIMTGITEHISGEDIPVCCWAHIPQLPSGNPEPQPPIPAPPMPPANMLWLLSIMPWPEAHMPLLEPIISVLEFIIPLLEPIMSMLEPIIPLLALNMPLLEPIMPLLPIMPVIPLLAPIMPLLEPMNPLLDPIIPPLLAPIIPLLAHIIPLPIIP
mmetsp:Transcript_44394/g.94605  ORF Transcript_44394/g.94605 Transcript_44394/m.94605 type:complete len:313 (+) Transcript_44394:668-1606(+)